MPRQYRCSSANTNPALGGDTYPLLVQTVVDVVVPHPDAPHDEALIFPDAGGASSSRFTLLSWRVAISEEALHPAQVNPGDHLYPVAPSARRGLGVRILERSGLLGPISGNSERQALRL